MSRVVPSTHAAVRTGCLRLITIPSFIHNGFAFFVYFGGNCCLHGCFCLICRLHGGEVGHIFVPAFKLNTTAEYQRTREVHKLYSCPHTSEIYFKWCLLSSFVSQGRSSLLNNCSNIRGAKAEDRVLHWVGFF